MQQRRDWSLEPTQALFDRFLRLERINSYFYFPAWWARMSREVAIDVGRHAWGCATKAERTALVIAHCDELIREQGESQQCTAITSRPRNGARPATCNSSTK